MQILIVKTSSMGDVIHTFPAITDLVKHHPNVKIDWVVEENFAELPRLHPAVNRVIPIALRKWRKNLFCVETLKAVQLFCKELRRTTYDYVIDAQGLLKSAVITKLAQSSKSGRNGLDSVSSRGKYITWAYDKTFSIPKDLHAVKRLKLLFSKVFNYEYQENNLDYGLNKTGAKITKTPPYLVFLHCTTWESKKWPVVYWRELITTALRHGYFVKLNSGNAKELNDAHLIAKNFSSAEVEVMPPQSITSLTEVIARSHGVVSVDTGLGHLAAALSVSGVGIYGATDPKLTSILSHKFMNLSANYPCAPCLLRDCNKLDSSNSSPPCYSTLSPARVWDALQGERKIT